MLDNQKNCKRLSQTGGKSLGLTQAEVAQKLNVSFQAVSKWESEQSMPDLEKVIIMSELFEVTTDYILKGIEPSFSDK